MGGITGGKGGKNGENESANALADMAGEMYKETRPLRTPMINRGTRFLQGNLDVTASPMWGASRSGIDTGYAQARENLFATVPRGGALYGQLGDVERARAHDMAMARGTIAEGELNRALQLGTWGAAQGTQGLGSAASAQAQQLAAQQQAKGAKGQGLGQLGGAAMGAYAMGAFSDRRLKRDILRIGTLSNGVPLYQFRYIWGGPVHLGVMADEVPWARVLHPSGFWLVDYSRVI